MTNKLPQPRVSVIIPNYQHAKFLEKRIQSVLDQTFQDFEIILLDDASTDGSSAIIEKYRTNPKVSHVIFNESNIGKPFLQWQRGMKLALGSLIWIAESDDVSKPEFLATMVHQFDRIQYLVLATVMLEYIDDCGESLGLVEEDLRGTYSGLDVMAKELGHRNCIRNASAVVFDKQIGLIYIDEVTSYFFSGDWYFWSLIAMHPGAKMHFNPARLCLYRFHGNSVHGRIRSSKNTALLAAERFKIMANINLHHTKESIAIKSLRKFIALNNGFQFWIYGISSNFNLFSKVFLRPNYWGLLINIANTIALSLLANLKNKVCKILFYSRILYDQIIKFFYKKIKRIN